MKFTIALAGCLPLVAGLGFPQYRRVARTDRYDQGTPQAPVDNTAGGFIAYNGWGYSPQLVPSAPSGAQVIATGPRGQLLEGQPAFLPINDTVKCFDLKSIRNACSVIEEGAGVLVPVSCTVQFSARSAITGDVETKPAIYNPRSPVEPFNTTVFPPDFRCIDRVDVTLLSATVPAGGTTVGILLDDFSYVALVRR